MKLFHTENGKETVYVQMEDIMHIQHVCMSIPATIFLKVFDKDVVIIDDSNRYNFVKFDEEHEVQFFKELDFVIDYNHYKDLTNKQLEEEGNKLVAKLNNIAKKWNTMTPEERKHNGDLYQEYQKLEYMLSFLSDIYSMEDWKRTMPFPDFIEIPKNRKRNRFLKEKKM